MIGTSGEKLIEAVEREDFSGAIDMLASHIPTLDVSPIQEINARLMRARSSLSRYFAVQGAGMGNPKGLIDEVSEEIDGLTEQLRRGILQYVENLSEVVPQ